MPSTPLEAKRHASNDSSQETYKLIKPETLLCRVKYQNTLPEIPFDPKFRPLPLESSRFVQYVATSLERNYKHELLTENDVGVVVDLIDPDVFKIDETIKLHPNDELLLEDDAPLGAKARKSRHEQMVSWLRKTEYISTEIYTKYNKGDKVESRLGYNLKRRMTDENIYRDRDSQIRAIEKTFEAAKLPIEKHYSKPDVHAVEVLPVLPDFSLWRYPCAQVIFDDNPARKELSASQQREEANQAMIRGMVDETGDHFVAYFLPTEETKQQRRLDCEQGYAYTEGANYEYELAREYNWNVKNKTMSNYEKNYFFVFRKDGVFYNELETKVRLSKRRKLNSSALAGSSRFPTQTGTTNKTRLIVGHKDFTEEELKAQNDRLYMLEHEVEEEEEEEDEDAQPGDEDADNDDANENNDDIEEEDEDLAVQSDAESANSVASEEQNSPMDSRSNPVRKSAKQFVFSSDSEEEEEDKVSAEEQNANGGNKSGDESSDLSDL